MSCACSPATDFEPIHCGADYAYDLEVSQIPDGGTDAAAVPLNLTSATFRAQLRRTAASSTVLATFTVTITDGPNGKATLSLPASVTANLPATPCDSGWAHDVYATLSDGRNLCLQELVYLTVIPAASR
jgi:hypothetical protein